MQYDPSHPEDGKAQHGMRFDPFKALIVPRPIGWISTVSKTGQINLAPFSFFNALSDKPPMLVASIGNDKDSVVNILDTKECTVCVVNTELMDQMNMSSAAVDSAVSEFDLAKLGSEKSSLVKSPRVAGCPAAFECRLWQSIPLPVDEKSGLGYTTVILEVVSVYINDKYIANGRVDIPSMQPVARLGYMDYAVINEANLFTLNRPSVAEDGKTATLDTTPWDGKYR